MSTTAIKLLNFCFIILLFSISKLALGNGLASLPIDFNATSYNVAEGLSQSTVTSIVEDNEGFVWIGTLNGLNRFDGKEFEHFYADESSGLPSSFIRSLAVDDKGVLYVGTDKGLVQYKNSTEQFEPAYTSILPKNLPVWTISNDSQYFYIGSEKKVFVIDNETKLLVNYWEDVRFDGIKHIEHIENSTIVRSYDGKVYELTNDRVLLLVDNSTNIVKTGDTLKIFTNKASKTKNTNKDIIVINDPQLESITKYNENSALGIKGDDLLQYSNSSHIKSIGHIKEIKDSFDNPGLYITTNGIYITTVNFGFIQIKKESNLVQNVIDIDQNIWSISKLKESKNLLITTDSNIINEYDKDLSLVASYDSKIDGPKSTIVTDGYIFIASAQGLYRINRDSRVQQFLLEGRFTTVKTSENKQFIYAGTDEGYLYELNNNGKLITKTLIDQGNPIFDIENKNGVTYIATQGGLHQFSDDKVVNIFKDDIVFSIHRKDGFLYFGTRTSFKSLDIDKNTVSTLIENNKAIYSINSLDDFIIAASTEEIIIFNEKTNKQYILSKNNGSQDEYNNQALVKDKSTIVIGGTLGLSKLNIDDIKHYIKNKRSPVTHLKSLSLFNIVVSPPEIPKPVNSLEEIKLKHSDYPFSLTFNTPTSDASFKYRMKGLSDTWIASSSFNTATYTNLSPETYVFQVFAIDSLTGEEGPTKEILITVTPPWWLSTTAKSVYFVLFLIVIFMAVKLILRRRKVQRQIAISEERLKLSLWGSGDEMWDWDIETGQIYRSNIWGSLEFPKDGQRAGTNAEESNIHPVDQDRVRKALQGHFNGEVDHFEAAYRVKGKHDDWVWILDRAKIVERDENDQPVRMTGTIKNINKFKHAEEQLRLFERAIENISEGMFILDSQYRFVEVNDACCSISNKAKANFIGKLLKFDLYPDSFSEQIRLLLKQQGSWSGEIESLRGADDRFLIELTIDAIYDDQGILTHYVGIFSDISLRKQQEEELRKLTNIDLLTGLPNRSNLLVTLSNLVKRESHHTLMVLDLDNFKRINDSLGHQVGDELLTIIAKRIEASIPSYTYLYRLGGDEFALLVDKNPDIGSSAAIANRIRDSFSLPFDVDSEKLVLSASIGIVLYPEDETNEQALLRKADIAMYHAKSAGGGRYQFYSESLNRNAIRQLEVENLIREGLRDDLFEVYYQPKVGVKSHQLVGMEALVRLNHPTLGLVPPNDFIPLAEENGLIVDIGDLVLKKACFAAQKWREQGLFSGRVAVNLSSHQFALPDLQQRIESVLRLTQLPAENLELEITEGTVIKHPEKAIQVMQQLAQMGDSLALDDFGTGYSSLSYLKRFPIHTLKIDKAFIDDIDKSDRDLKMVDSIITIAHNMGLSVVGEGVEEASQLNILKALNCEEIQGYYFSKAVPESEFGELLTTRYGEILNQQKTN